MRQAKVMMTELKIKQSELQVLESNFNSLRDISFFSLNFMVYFQDHAEHSKFSEKFTYPT